MAACSKSGRGGLRMRRTSGGGCLLPARRNGRAPRSFGPEEYILGWLFLRPELLGQLDEEMISQQAPPLSPEDLSSAENQALLTAVMSLPAKPRGDATVEERLAGLAEPLRAGGKAAVEQVRLRPPLTDEKLIKDLGDSLLRTRERNLKRQVQQLEFLLARAGTSGP